MFNCYVHGWSSYDYACRLCFPMKVTTSSSTTFVYPEAIVGVSSEELKGLQAENARLREALNSLANEASGFLHCADAVQHGVTNMRVFQLRIDEARAALEGKE